MTGEQALGDDLDEWLDTRADELGIDRKRLLARLVSAHRLALSGAGDGIEELPTAIADLESRVSAVEDELDEKIDDVRERVIQLKREVDTKAPDDHGHPDLADRLDALAEELDALRVAHDDLRSDHGAIRDEHETLRADLDAGFENFEVILEDLDSDTAELAEKADTLARVALDLRTRVASLEGESSVRNAVAELRREANYAGVSSATCYDCGSSVHVGLLGAPVCPHCEAIFDGVEPARGFFGSATMTTGERPALTGGSDDRTKHTETRADRDDRDADRPAVEDLFAGDEDD
jgi:predicted  nucleic acid-binding Zn-ribbon protein